MILARLAVPLTAAYIAEMGMVITDMMIVGRLGSEELAAVGLAGDWFWVLLVLGMGLVAIVSVLAAQAKGAGDTGAVIDAAEQGMIAATLTSLPIMLAVFSLGPLLSWTGQDPETLALLTDYSCVVTFAVPAGLWFMVLRNYVTALGESGVIGWIFVAALLLNAVLNVTFVYGLFGLPALGVIGAGLGTTIVNWLMFASLAWLTLTGASIARYRPRIIPRRIKPRVLREIFALGIPIALTEAVMGAMYTVVAVIAGSLGAATLAAQQIIYSVIYLALSGSEALGDAVRVRVAYGIGIGSVGTANQAARIAMVIGIALSLLGASVLWLMPGLLVSAFLDTGTPASQEVLDIAVVLAGYAGFFLLLDGVYLVIANAIRGLRDTRSPLIGAAIGYWAIGIGAGTTLCLGFGLGAEGLWLGMILGVFVAICLMLGIWPRRIREARVRLAG